MGSTKELFTEEQADNRLADDLNITMDELSDCGFYKVEIISNKDGIYLYRVFSFAKDTPTEIINKIKERHGVPDEDDNYYTVELPLEDEPFEEDFYDDDLENKQDLNSIHKENHAHPDSNF
jgi:hypothetical protein